MVDGDLLAVTCREATTREALLIDHGVLTATPGRCSLISRVATVSHDVIACLLESAEYS